MLPPIYHIIDLQKREPKPKKQALPYGGQQKCPGRETAQGAIDRRDAGAQLFSSKVIPQLRQVTWIRPLPLGTRICCLQLGQRK